MPVRNAHGVISIKKLHACDANVRIIPIVVINDRAAQVKNIDLTIKASISRDFDAIVVIVPIAVINGRDTSIKNINFIGSLSMKFPNGINVIIIPREAIVANISQVKNKVLNECFSI